jgi:Family of unknown function (DUF6459)
MSPTAQLVAMPAPEPAPTTDGALALRLESDPERQPTPKLRLVSREDNPSDPAEELPDVQAWAVRLVQALAEVVAGDRPIGQLIRWTDGTVYAELNRRVRLLGLTTTAGSRGSSDRAQIRSVHVSQPAPLVAEVAAHIRHGGRSRALALRLEVHRDRWICTAVQLG